MCGKVFDITNPGGHHPETSNSGRHLLSVLKDLSNTRYEK